jgi:hypothetical protein
MKNITFSAEDALITQARGLAQGRGTTLNEEFRIWLATYAMQEGQNMKHAQTRALLDQLTTPDAGQNLVPNAHRYAAADARVPSRQALSEREQRMVNRLDGVPNNGSAAPDVIRG